MSPAIVDLEAVACLFARPALDGEFIPKPLWRGLTRIRHVPDPASQRQPLIDVFTSVLAEQVDGTDVVGVQLSGGLDSFAVLVRLLALPSDRRVVVLTTNLIDDLDGSSVTAARRLVELLPGRVEFVTVDPERHRAQPRWSPHGPRLGAMPAVRAGTVAIAADLGIEVLLNGDGADELLCIHRYASGSLLRHHGPRTTARYLRDVAHTGPGLAGEALAWLSAVAPRQLGTEAYWALNYPELCRPAAAGVLTAPMQDVARNWARNWIAQTINDHVAAERSWAEADAFDAMWPFDPDPPAGDIPERSPFLAPRFVEAVRALPIHEREPPRD